MTTPLYSARTEGYEFITPARAKARTILGSLFGDGPMVIDGSAHDWDRDNWVEHVSERDVDDMAGFNYPMNGRGWPNG